MRRYGIISLFFNRHVFCTRGTCSVNTRYTLTHIFNKGNCRIYIFLITVHPHHQMSGEFSQIQNLKNVMDKRTEPWKWCNCVTRWTLKSLQKSWLGCRKLCTIKQVALVTVPSYTSLFHNNFDFYKINYTYTYAGVHIQHTKMIWDCFVFHRNSLVSIRLCRCLDGCCILF